MLKDLVTYTPMYVTLFWSIILVFSARKSNRAKHFLGVFMIAAFLVYLSHAMYFNGTKTIYIIFDPVYMFASLSVYPLYYWYIRLLTIETEYRLRNLLSLVPGLTLAICSAIVYMIMTPEQVEIYYRGFLLNEGFSNPVPIIIKVQSGIHTCSRIVFSFQVIFFLVYGRKLVIRYNERISDFYSNLESKTIVWVRVLLVSFVITSLMSAVFNIIGRDAFRDSVTLLLIPSSIFSALLFLIGWQGYLQNHTVTDLIKDENALVEINQKKYNQVQLKKKLLHLFSSERIYKDPELNLTQVAILLKTNRTYISTLINSEFSCTFNKFVNDYRLTEAKNMLSDQAFNNYSLEHISEAAGFGSLNTFIRVFKDSEGITPGKYRDKADEDLRTMINDF